MKAAVIFCFFVWISISTASKLDYYWKDFDGSIPKDAFIGYLDRDQQSIFVGLGYFKGAGLLAATIFPNVPTITVQERGQNPVISKNIMILCTQNSNALQWVQVDYNNLKAIQNISFLKIIEAGTESDAPCYVGRHFHEGIMQIGRVYLVSPYEGLNIPNKSGGATSFQNFEILVYCTVC